MLVNDKVLRPTVAIIDLAAFRHNIEEIRHLVGPKIKMMAVLKADAYGHGAIQLAREAISAGVEYLAVAIPEEGIQLRKANISTPILILQGFFDNNAKSLLEYNLTPVIFDSQGLQVLSRLGKRASRSIPFHLKIDTGMGRLGFNFMDDLEDITAVGALQMIVKDRYLKLEGIMTHFGNADSQDPSYTGLQLQRFINFLNHVKKAGISVPFIHTANTAAILTWRESYFNMVRPGLALYGVYPSQALREKAKLQPVLTWKTEVHQVKPLPKGVSVSYGSAFVTAKETKIAVLPVGYADGYNRSLSNCGEVLIHGERVPVVGHVCMDMTMIGVTGISNVKVGDEAILIGKQNDAQISVEEISQKMDVIPYEVLSSVSKRVPRIYSGSNRAQE